MDPNLRAGSQSFVECCCHCLSTSGWMSVEKKTFESKLHEVKVDTCKPTISLWFSCWQRFLAPLAVVAQLVKILVDHLTHCSKTKTKNNNSHLWLRKHQRIFSWLISSFCLFFPLQLLWSFILRQNGLLAAKSVPAESLEISIQNKNQN